MKKQESRPYFFTKRGSVARKSFAGTGASAVLCVVLFGAVLFGAVLLGVSANAQAPATNTGSHVINGIPAPAWWAGFHLDSASPQADFNFNNSANVTIGGALPQNVLRGILTSADESFTFANGITMDVSRTDTVGADIASIGFSYIGGVGDYFSSNINGRGATIRASNATGQAIGMDFRLLAAGNTAWEDDADIRGSLIRLGSIEALAGTFNGAGSTFVGNSSQGAFGFSAGSVEAGSTVAISSIVARGGEAYGFVLGRAIEGGASVSLGSVEAQATLAGRSATGVQLFGGVDGGELSITSLNVQSVGDARGFLAGDVGRGVDVFSDIDGNVTIGTVDVLSTAGDAFGVEAREATLNLRGDITATANNGMAFGILTEGNATLNILNDVTLTATAAHSGDAFGIWTGNDLTVIGSGRVDLGVAVVHGDAIFGDGSNELTIILDKDTSKLSGSHWGNELHSNTTLVLLGDARGEFRHLGEWAIEDGAFVGDTLTDWFVNQNNFLEAVAAKQARVSDGYLAAFMMHNRFAAWNAVRDRMISGNEFSSFTTRTHHPRQQQHHHRGHFRGQAPCDCHSCGPISSSPCDPVFTHSCGPDRFLHSSLMHCATRTAWVNYIGRSNAYRSSYHNQNWRLSAEGVQGGADLIRTHRGQLGVLFGYESGRMRSNADRIKMDDVYFGAYLARVFFNGMDIRGVFSYGFQDYDMQRFVSGSGFYTSSFKGNTMEANLELGRRFSAGAWSLRPAIAADVFNNKLKGATEREIGGATFDRVDLTQVFLRTGAELRYQGRSFTFNSGVFYSYDLNGKDLRTRVSKGAFSAPLLGTTLGRELLTFNLGGEYQFAGSLFLFGGYQGEYVLDRTYSRLHNIGHAGAGLRW